MKLIDAIWYSSVRGNMLQIARYDGYVCNLSDEIYQIEHTPDMLKGDNKYKVGTFVRLISGVDKSERPGYHFVPTHVTVCRIDAECAEFVGIRRKWLRKI